MPVHIYDISKKLGIENKHVLAKAKTLGIAAARVASSSLDKITAEYLSEELRKGLDRGEIPPYTPQPAQPPASLSPPDNALSRALGLRDAPAPTAPAKPSPPPASPTPLSTPSIPSQPPPAPSAPQSRFTFSFVLGQILSRLANGAPYSARSFERDVTRLLTDLFPFSVLSGVRLFSSEPCGRIDFGFEMDNLLHLRLGEIDHIVIVEVKNQSVNTDKGRWSVQYDGSTSCAREQVDNHNEIAKAPVSDEWRKLPLCQSTQHQRQQPADDAQGSRSVCE